MVPAEGIGIFTGVGRVENRRSGGSLPVACDAAFASPPQSGLTWLWFLFPLIGNCGSRTRSFSKYRKANSLQMGEKIEFP
jgi:hypothetical protein